jgi:hypothetical protein
MKEDDGKDVEEDEINIQTSVDSPAGNTCSQSGTQPVRYCDESDVEEDPEEEFIPKSNGGSESSDIMTQDSPGKFHFSCIIIEDNS